MRRSAVAGVPGALLLLAMVLGPVQPAAATIKVTEMTATGMNVSAAQTTYTQGNPSVLVAYVEGGINWHGDTASALATVAYVNWHEVPVPCKGTTVATATMVIGGVTQACHTDYSSAAADYNPDGSGTVNSAQWATDPRVKNVGATAFLNPEDLMAAFCTASYAPPLDAAGRQCDVSGWDFYDRQNDPATIDTAYNHANDQMGVIHRMCPKCMVMPVKAGDEALDPTDNLAKAWLFAADEGARVIVSVSADLGYSPYMRQVINSLEKRGVVMVEASNDFDSNDHQGGMFWPYVIPGNGSVASSGGTAWVRSDETSWGPHNLLTAATGGGSTSESTPTLGGVLALLLSYGVKAYATHLITSPLTGPEAVQDLEQTAKPFTNTSLGWPGTALVAGAPDDWNPQYGYGMPTEVAAMAKIASSKVPADATIDSPDWYTSYDPTSTTSVTVTGHIDAASSTTTFSWKLEAANGPGPTNASFNALVVGTGTSTGSYTGTLGTLPLSSIPSALWEAPYTLSTKQTLPNATQYAVTFRLVVTETSGISSGVQSEDRRSVDVAHDASLLPGFPKVIDPGSAGVGSAGSTGLQARASAESQPQLVDLQGTGKLAMVFGDSGGLVHAVDPTTGGELPGWPVQVQAVPDIVNQTSITPGGQPIIANVAVGDLFQTGQLDVVVSTIDGTVDAYSAQGLSLPGWPKSMATGTTPPAIPRPEEPNVRIPNRETLAAPVLADLTGSGELDIVMAGGNGQVAAWSPTGTALPGWPARAALAPTFTVQTGYVLENDQTLTATPTVVWFHGHTQPPDIVERSQFSEIKGPGIQELPFNFMMGYSETGATLPSWPVAVQGLVSYYGSAQQQITEGTSSTAAGDLGGTGNDAVIDSPLLTPSQEFNATGNFVGVIGNGTPIVNTLLKTLKFSTAQCQTTLAPDTAVPFTSSGALGTLGGTLAFIQSGIGSAALGCLQHPNAEIPIPNGETAFPANAANPGASTPLGGFPAVRQGDSFLTSPLITSVSAGGGEAVIEGGDSSTINGFTSAGKEAPGFPKFTSGWDLYGPSAGDLLSNGKTDVVTTTREGYIYAWSTTGNATTNDQWWSTHHDEYNDGNYGVDSRSPGAIRSTSWTAGASKVSFIDPGYNWEDGTATSLLVTEEPTGSVATVTPAGPSGTADSVTGPPGTRGVRLQAKDSNGNLGPAVTFGTLSPTKPVLSVAATANTVVSHSVGTSFKLTIVSTLSADTTHNAPVVTVSLATTESFTGPLAGSNWTCAAPVGQTDTCTDTNAVVAPGTLGAISGEVTLSGAGVTVPTTVTLSDTKDAATPSISGFKESSTLTPVLKVVATAATLTSHFVGTTFKLTVQSTVSGGKTSNAPAVSIKLATTESFTGLLSGSNWTCTAPLGRTDTCSTSAAVVTPGTLGAITGTIRFTSPGATETNSVTISDTRDAALPSTSTFVESASTVPSLSIHASARLPVNSHSIGTTYTLTVKSAVLSGKTFHAPSVLLTLPTTQTFTGVPSGTNWSCTLVSAREATCATTSTSMPLGTLPALSGTVVFTGAGAGKTIVAVMSDTQDKSSPSTSLFQEASTAAPVLSVTASAQTSLSRSVGTSYKLVVKTTVSGGTTYSPPTLIITLPTTESFSGPLSGPNWICATPAGTTDKCSSATDSVFGTRGDITGMVTLTGTGTTMLTTATFSDTADKARTVSSSFKRMATAGPILKVVASARTVSSHSVGSSFTLTIQSTISSGKTYNSPVIDVTLPTTESFTGLLSGSNWICTAPVGKADKCTDKFQSIMGTLGPIRGTIMFTGAGVIKPMTVLLSDPVDNAVSSSSIISESSTAAPVLAVEASARTAVSHSVGTTYQLTVLSAVTSGSTAHAPSVTITLPASESFTGLLTGSNWNCTLPIGGVDTCTNTTASVTGTLGPITATIKFTGVGVTALTTVTLSDVHDAAVLRSSSYRESSTANPGLNVIATAQTLTSDEVGSSFKLTIQSTVWFGSTYNTPVVTVTLPPTESFTGSLSGSNWKCTAPVTKADRCTDVSTSVMGTLGAITGSIHFNGAGSTEPTVVTLSDPIDQAVPTSSTFKETTTTRSTTTGTTPTTTSPKSGTPKKPTSPANAKSMALLGYVLVGSDGGAFAYGGVHFSGSMANKHLDSPIVGIAVTPDGQGYWEVAADGGVFSFGNAPFFGSMASRHLASPVVAMASTPDGGGYWLVSVDGGVFSFGNAPFFGSMASRHLASPVVAMASTPDGGGYWLVSVDGGVFSFGNAPFFGSMASRHLASPVVAMASTPDGGGYWLVSVDGGVFSFGNAPFFGSMHGKKSQAPIVDLIGGGGGYIEIGADGGVFAFGGALYEGSRAGHVLRAPVVGASS